VAIEDDVLVIGGGLAGSMAALSAAERGLRVRLVSNEGSTLRSASGLVDLLGYTPDGEGPIAEPFEHLTDLPAGHPYERVGPRAVREALSVFDAVVGDAYAGAHTDANALVPTVGGSIKPTARYPASVAAGLASDPRDTLLVGFERLPGFDAPLAAASLEATGVPFRVRGVTVQFPGIECDDAAITRHARALDLDERVDGASTRAALAERVRPELNGAARVGFPALLGIDHDRVVRRDLAERLGVPAFELPGGPPSVPGIRLEERLRSVLAEAGVRVTTGVRVVGHESERDGSRSAGQRIERLLVDRSGRRVPYRAEQYVLATGGLVGGGIDSSRAGVREPIFGCHVPHPEDRYEWFDDEPFGDHPFARFGLAVDRSLRPLTADGDPEFANLRAAGGVLGGADFAVEKSGSGISIATGYVAGSHAGREAAA